VSTFHTQAGIDEITTVTRQHIFHVISSGIVPQSCSRY